MFAGSIRGVPRIVDREGGGQFGKSLRGDLRELVFFYCNFYVVGGGGDIYIWRLEKLEFVSIISFEFLYI